MDVKARTALLGMVPAARLMAPRSHLGPPRVFGDSQPSRIAVQTARVTHQGQPTARMGVLPHGSSWSRRFRLVAVTPVTRVERSSRSGIRQQLETLIERKKLLKYSERQPRLHHKNTVTQ